VLLTILLIVWIIAIFAIAIPSRVYRNLFDRATQGRYRDDRDNLRILIDHLRSFPEEWSISRDQASFPKEGAKKIYLSYDKTKRDWEYTLSAFSSTPRPLDGHYGAQMSSILLEENNRREKESLARTFYPNLDGPLMIGTR
jgi:hypothetical protein